jgi:hypothetical protein
VLLPGFYLQAGRVSGTLHTISTISNFLLERLHNLLSLSFVDLDAESVVLKEGDFPFRLSFILLLCKTEDRLQEPQLPGLVKLCQDAPLGLLLPDPRIVNPTPVAVFSAALLSY